MRRSLTVLGLLLAGVALLVAVATNLLAAGPQPTLTGVIAGDGYTTLTLQFSADVYSLADPSQADLTPADFILTGAGSASISSVQRAGAGQDAWRITLSEAVVPHTAWITPTANVGNGGGPVAPFTQSVPFSSADLTALAAYLPNLQLLQGGAVALPLVGDWLQADKSLSALVGGITSLPTTTEAAFDQFLAARGITATYSGRQVTFTFDETVAKASHAMSGTAGVGSVGGALFDLSLAGSMNAEVALSGSLSLNVGAGGSISPVGPGPTLRLRSTGTFAPTGRLGAFDVSATAQANLDAAISLPDLGAASPPLLTGTATLDLTQLAISGTSLNYSASGSNPLLRVNWPDLGHLQVTDGDGNPADNIQIQADQFDTLALRNFTRASVDQLLGGLNWFAGWLTEVQGYDVMTHKLPLVGKSVGELAQLADRLAQPVIDLTQITTLAGDVSIQELGSICSTMTAAQLDTQIDSYAAAAGISGDDLTRLRARLQQALSTCNGMLSSMQISAEEITFRLTASSTADLFDGSASAALDLGLGDLAGIELSATTGTWARDEASANFSLTFGMKLGPAAALGIPADAEPGVNLGHRFFVKSGEVASASLDLQGDGFGLGARLGFLDLGITGSAALNPSIRVSLVDPDGQITLLDMAQAADAEALGSLISLSVSGDVNATFTLANESLFGSNTRSLTISGPFTSPTLSHNLGDALNLKGISAAEAIRMIVGIAQQLAAMGETELLSRSIPFVDVSFKDAVGFTTAFADVAKRVEQRNPQTISALQAALNDALASVGMPSSVTVGVSGEELTLTFNASKSVARSYPFSFEGGGLSFAPAEGGASLTAAANLAFNPTIGIRFAGAGTLEERIFLRGVGPRFELSAAANAFGSITLGPMSAGLQGRVELGSTTTPAHLAVSLKGADSAGRISLRHLIDSLQGGAVGDLIDVSYGGRVYGNLSLATSLGSGTVLIQGDLANPSEITVDPHLNFEIGLDLGTLVYGTVESSRFVGRLLAQSDVITADLPVIGDDLRALTDVGAKLQSVAEELDQLWQTANDGNAFVGQIESTLDDLLCPSTKECVTVSLLPAGATLATATAVEVRLHFAQNGTATTALKSGINLDPIFHLEMDLNPQLTYGYDLDLVLGLSVADGFYLRAGEGPNRDLLQLYAGLQMQNNVNASVSLLGIDSSITAGSITIGGTMGPNGNAGGFAVGIPDKIRLRDLSNRHKSVDQIVAPRFDAILTASLPLKTEVPDLLALTVPIHLQTKADLKGKPQTILTLGCSAALLPELCATDEQITLDASSLARIIEPALGPFAEYNPLGRPEIKTVLNEKVPAIELSLRDVLKSAAIGAGKESEWEVVEFLLDLDEKLDELRNAAGQGVIELGWVKVTPDYQYYKPAFAPFAQPGGASFSASLTSAAGSSQILRFPILENPGDAIGLLLGGDKGGTVTFVEFSPPEIFIGPSINWSQSLFELNTGFLDGGLKVSFQARLGLGLHIGFGYDSSGLATGNWADGFYVIDYPEFEVWLEGSISGAIDGHASVLWGVASVRFRGAAGVSAKVGLDIFTEAIALPASSRNQKNQPPRLHLNDVQTIANAYSFPGLPEGYAYPCIFQLGVKVNAFINFSGKAKVLGITVFNESFNKKWDFIDKTYSCSIILKAAHIDGRRLILNGGTYADRRFDGDGDLAESFEIRPVGGGDDEVTVKVTTSKRSITTTFKTKDFDLIYAELGLGNDRVEIDSRLSIPAELYGGEGDDELIGGRGDDILDGGPGRNILKGIAGKNHLIGGDGDDELWAGSGEDLLQGGGGTNRYVMAGVWGKAEVDDAAGRAKLHFETAQALTGTSNFFEGSVKGSAGSRLTYAVDQVAEILGGSAADTFTINRYYQEGFRIDLREGHDSITALFSGADRTIGVTDSDRDATLIAQGTAGNDTFLFRANGPASGPATHGFIALVTPNQAVDRVNYDDSISLVKVDEKRGANHFVLDDTAAPLEINGGDGGSTFQVGQIFGNPRTPPYVAAGDEVRTRNVEGRGPMSLGVSHPTTLRGGKGNDKFTVFSNVAPLTLEGVAGDNLFVLRAFIMEGSVQAKGGDGNDRFEYVPNQHVAIDGGTGFNTLMIIGTELSDGFVVDADGIKICPQYAPSALPAWAPVGRLPNPTHASCAINASYTRIQQIFVHGVAGNDAFWVRSTSAESALRLYGGADGATFLIGNQGDLTGIEGPVTVDGDTDPEFDASVPAPVVLPGEDGAPGREPVLGQYDDQVDRLVVDGSAALTAQTGTLTAERISGLGMGDDVVITTPEGARSFPGGVTYGSIGDLKVLMGQGDDRFTVESTAESTENLIRGGGGDDQIAVRSIDGRTTVEGQGGQNTTRVGSHAANGATLPDRASVLTGIATQLHVVGSPSGQDQLILDASGTAIGATAGERVDVDQDRVTELSMPGEVTYQGLGSLEIFLTGGTDVANVHGTTATTSIHGLEGDDRFFVSDQADLAVGAPTPPYLDGKLAQISGDLQVQAGTGKNLIMVSDRASSAGVTGAILTAGRMEGLAQGAISYATSGDGTFAGGITVWTGSGADQIAVQGARRDGDPTTLAWEGRAEGGVRTLTTLNTGAGNDVVSVALQSATDGLFVLNTGSGDDVVDGSASTLGFIAFGGDGNDQLSSGSGDDLLFGDHGRVEYCAGASFGYHGGVESCGTAIRTLLGDENVANLNDGRAWRPARIYSLDLGAPGPTDGWPYAEEGGQAIWPQGFNNRIQTGAGDDIAFGGSGSDLITAESGRNLLLGDHGEVWRVLPTALGGQQLIQSKDPFIRATVLTESIAYVANLTHPTKGGGDLLLGGSGSDWIFSGPGDDIVNGRAGTDIIWGGDGHDILWGGTGDDRIYGGAGDDVIDLKLSSYQAGLHLTPSNAVWWQLAWFVADSNEKDGNPLTDNGSDLIYGGTGRDVMQADLGSGGPKPGDRMLDWYGSFNLFLTPSGPYGAGMVLRSPSPDHSEKLLQLGHADGAYSVRDERSSGWQQLSLVTQANADANRNPPHPDHPGNKAGF